MKGERTAEDRDHVDVEPTKNKELKELMPDEASAIEKTDHRAGAGDRNAQELKEAGEKSKRKQQQ